MFKGAEDGLFEVMFPGDTARDKETKVRGILGYQGKPAVGDEESDKR
jgi:hypothetical protein